MKATIAVHKFSANFYKLGRKEKSVKSSAYWGNSINNPDGKNNTSFFYIS